MWAPWRKAYLRSNPSKKRGCLFCRLLKEKNDKKNLVLFRSPHHAVILNRYPYNNGHLMIVPKRHIDCPSKLNTQEKAEFFDVLEIIHVAVQKVMKPHGFNLGMNVSDAAGAGIPGHLHWHMVPRWRGDSNFMSVIGETKVISESLKSAYDLLARALSVRSGSGKKQMSCRSKRIGRKKK